MGKVIAAVFTAIIAPISVFVAQQHFKKEEPPAAAKDTTPAKVEKANDRKGGDEKPGDAKAARKPGEPARVVAEGTGPTAEAAVEDAHRNAVRQFLPKLVEAGELSRKGKAIDAQVLADTDPLVRRSEVVESTRDRAKGRDVYRRVLQVTVDRPALAARLQAAGVRVQPQD
jgi:hypothetical protein